MKKQKTEGILKVKLGRTPFRASPRPTAPIMPLGKRYTEIARELAREADKVGNRIQRLEARLRADKERMRGISPSTGEFTSVRDHPELLSPKKLMELQVKVEALHTRRDSLRRDLPRYEHFATNWSSNFDEEMRCAIGRVAADDEEAFAQVAALVAYPEAVEMLAFKTGKYLTALIAGANAGNGRAIAGLADIAAAATQALNCLADQQLEAVQKVAAKSFDWPVMVSPKRNFDPNPFKFVETIAVGSSTTPEMHCGSNWDRHNSKGAEAWALWKYVRHTRAICRIALKDPTWKLDKFQTSAAALEEFSAASWEKWWDVAEMVVDETYPRKVKSKFKGRSMGSAMKRALKDKFKSFSGSNKV